MAFQSDRPVSLFEWAGLPSGYATDRSYERVLRYLVATQQVERHGERIVWTKGAEQTFLDRLVEAADARGLFAAERAAIDVMASTKITMEMLGA